ncbi:MAG: beta-ketoacyl-ACP synthase III [bacterium]
MEVYITDLAAFLPNEPVTNDEIESIMGRASGISSRIRRTVLRNNGIKTRYYAIDRRSGEITHTNAQMTAEAVRRLRPSAHFSLHDIECLCCGTSTPDQLMPGHASMVHGELGNPPCEVVSTSGICISGMTAMKFGFASIAAGMSRNAVTTGSEAASTLFRMQRHPNPGTTSPETTPEDSPILGFNAEFLKWMLSDGAGAAFLESRPADNRLSLRIDWIEQVSFANELETCMYAGAVKHENGILQGWRGFDSLQEAMDNNCFAIHQDVKLLNREIVKTAVDRTVPIIIRKHNLSASDVDWFLPHYSSEFFKNDFYLRLKSIGFEIPLEKWFTNLHTKGNTGAASIYIILDELFHSQKIQKGQKLLCFIPESGRFSICYMLLTAV